MGNNFFRGGDSSLQNVAPLGTGAVATQTRAVAVVPFKCRVKAIRIFGQGPVAGTSLTAEVFQRTAAGAAGSSLNTALDVKFASEAAAKTGVAAALTSAIANRVLSKGRLVEVVFTATAITAGPGDVTVVVEFEPIV